MLAKTSKYLIIIIILITGCSENKDEKIENIRLNEKLAKELVSLSVKCVDKKYPYKIGYRFSDESWLKPHYELTPSFYGCWDWHSAVHGHWAMVKILKDYPEITDRDVILSKLDKNLSKENLNKEYQFFKQDFAKGFERTYGWAWLMKLYSELVSWDNVKAQKWANNMKPLVDLLSERTILFLDKLSTPLRPGTHANTAFSFSLMMEYSIVANDKLLFNKIKEYSLQNFLEDIDCPVQYEPSGTDFLSPCLAEAALMSQILEKREFNDWLYKFLPSFHKGSFGKIINPPEVLDPEDPGIGHLIGLMFHRAWTLKDIAKKLEKNSDKSLLLKIAKNHSEAGYNIMFESGYGGEHWLATFAIYNFSK
ncbi:MAG: hypothetical protein CMC36_00035 [Flavobacteriaceae bacterium]|nr:hypothetical protein [Flavobacteriaceae bacterium]|tara:strand:- start:3426 stop:4520 length:1095 start_codon:yes stop_codon:yes gene_type:complete